MLRMNLLAATQSLALTWRCGINNSSLHHRLNWPNYAYAVCELNDAVHGAAGCNT
jgi:hypothetical protein